DRGLRAVTAGWIGLLIASLLAAYAGLWYFLPAQTVLIVHGAALLVLLPLGVIVLALNSAMPGSKFSAVGSQIGGTATRGEPMAAGGAAPRGGAPGPAAPRGIQARDAPDDLTNRDTGLTDPAEPPRVRQFFPETLLWKPELITDDQGRLRPLT